MSGLPSVRVKGRYSHRNQTQTHMRNTNLNKSSPIQHGRADMGPCQWSVPATHRVFSEDVGVAWNLSSLT